MPPTNKKKTRASRGLSMVDIKQLMNRNIEIMEVDHKIIASIGSGTPSIRSDANRGTFMALVIKDSNEIQSHQRTHTLHVPQNIPVPEAHHVIRHHLPNKSANPNIISLNRPKFKLPNHYIQYVSHCDPGKPSFHHFYDLRMDDIEWLVKRLEKTKHTSKLLIDETKKMNHSNEKNNNNNKNGFNLIKNASVGIESNRNSNAKCESVSSPNRSKIRLSKSDAFSYVRFVHLFLLFSVFFFVLLFFLLTFFLVFFLV